MDSERLLLAVKQDSREDMLALFTNPLLAIRYKLKEKIPDCDPLLENNPPLSCIAAYFGAIHCLEGLWENGDKFLITDETSLTAMDFAVIGNQMEAVKFLVNCGVKFEKSVFIAAKYGKIDLLSFFLKQNIDPMSTDSEGRTILHISAMHGQLDTVKYITSEIKVLDINAKDNEGNTALHLAIGNGIVDVGKYLLALPGVDTNPSNKHNESLFHMVARQQNADLLDSILAANGFGLEKQWDFMTIDYMAADDNVIERDAVQSSQNKAIDVNQVNDMSMTAFLVSAKEGGGAVVDAFLALDETDIGAKTREGMTALHVAVERHRPDIVYKLCHAGLNVNARDKEGRTPLTIACENGFLDIVQCLLDQPGIDVSAKEGGSAPIHIAARNGNMELAKMLMAKPGIDLALPDDENNTPLLLVSKAGHEEFLELLLAQPGVSLTDKDKNGLSALHAAARFNHIDIVKTLIGRKEIDINFRDSDGWTALHYASRNAHEEIVNILLEQTDIDVNVKDNRGKTPLYFAMNQKIRNALQAHGAV